MLTQDKLKSVLFYDPNTGEFKWLEGRKVKGKIAGSTTYQGYIHIAIEGKRYYAHRLAWLYMTGSWPLDQIDHKNRLKNDNRFDNLREANQFLQQGNIPVRAKWGRGICKRDNRWWARIQVDGYKVNIGTFDTLEEAKIAHTNKLKAIFGEFYSPM